MRLLIVRHAEAAPGTPDELRSLTPAGWQQARELGDRLRREGLVPHTVLSSPLLRARETAQALALGASEADERLAPGATAEDVRAAATGRGEMVLVIGHQPDCGQVAAALGDGTEPRFPPCGLAVLEVPE